MQIIVFELHSPAKIAQYAIIFQRINIMRATRGDIPDRLLGCLLAVSFECCIQNKKPRTLVESGVWACT